MGLADRRYGPSGYGGGHRRWGGGAVGHGGGAGLFGHALTPWVKRLLALNFGVYVLVNLLGLVPVGWVVDFLGFSAGTVLRRPWSPVTYMFVHGGFGHVLFNMLILFFFGPPLERLWGGREFLKFYLICGVGAALTSVILIQWIGPVTVIGASGALMGVLLAFALHWPDARVFLWFIVPVKVKYLVAFVILMDLWATRSAMGGAGGGVATWAHLGGAATAFIYLRYGERIGRRLRTMRPGRARLGVEKGGRGEAGNRKRKERGTRTGSSRHVDGDTLDEVDRILDKIRDEGIESLTPKERGFLDEMSRRYRG